jgi:cytochrome c oxidase subunit 2
MYFRGAPPDALRVQVLGQQFAWYFRYPGPDGQFGPTHVEKVNDAAGNFYGIDRERDAASKDDIVTATLAVPVNRPVELILLAKDVTHDFYVRELRIQQDMVPGMQIPVHFTATKTGRFEVMSEEDFQKWLQNMAAQQ